VPTIFYTAAGIFVGGVAVVSFLDWWLWHQDRRDKENA